MKNPFKKQPPAESESVDDLSPREAELLKGDYDRANALARTDDDEECVDLTPLQVEMIMLRRQNEGLAVRLAEREREVSALTENFVEATSALESLDSQVQLAREQVKNCPHCGKALKVEYPKVLYHPTKEPCLVKTAKEHRAKGSQWREKPWYSEPVMTAVNKQRNEATMAAEDRAALDAPHKRGRFLGGQHQPADYLRIGPGTPASDVPTTLVAPGKGKK